MESVLNKLPKDVLIKLIATVETDTSSKYKEQIAELTEYRDLCEMLIGKDQFYIERCCAGENMKKATGFSLADVYCKTRCTVGNSRSGVLFYDNFANYERCDNCSDCFCKVHVNDHMIQNVNGSFVCKNGC